MKRLVVCCDGTWNKPDAQTVTNVEKIARTVQTSTDQAGVTQLVYYVGGVGTGGYAADRLLGGAFGFGLFHNVIACYRFLAQNYEEGDEIFILGFSRGAFTARSLAGMVAKVGLLTSTALVEERLPEAVQIYQNKPMSTGEFGSGIGEFRHDHCQPGTKVTFLGVFDTVGAMGVPGFMHWAPKFHDLGLGRDVLCARQALAIDELRVKFVPSLWEAPPPKEGEPPPLTEDPRVKQVWFEGAHSDVGGGYQQTGLSDTALLWMAKEAHAAGLVFDAGLLNRYVNSGSDPIRHNPAKGFYRADNAYLRLKMRAGRGAKSSFEGGLRRLRTKHALSVRVASSAVAHYQTMEYTPANLVALDDASSGFNGIIESVVPLPEAGLAITDLGVPLARPEQAKKLDDGYDEKDA